MYIETDRLELKPFRLDYAEAFAKALQYPEIYAYLPEDVPFLKDIEAIIKWFIKRDQDNMETGFTGTNLSIHLKETCEIIGWCGLQPFEPEPCKTEIFYGLTPVYWNKGLITEAASAVLDYGFSGVHMEEIVAGVKPQNIASIRVLEKIGMRYVKTLRHVPNGSEFYANEWVYAFTKDRYFGTKP
ncbi:GNAT family N-acetyltransferase [Desulfoluna butyratoxydans]|uniref:Acyl-coa n-acyltransferase n=1 Tax=Desulfoluna butyratoxydans TaxID=231438 RepID=A0A4U8YMH8_9BACT|nr:GNAT family N-acetyltransferase [Desulfoluna butyratoxydans]VFQ42792.1 acyl-coa n-acyltransferase [Desulfoluna butyratoxydans]